MNITNIMNINNILNRVLFCMAHNHAHNNDDKSKCQLSVAVFINVLLTIAQVVGGVVSGSLSLIADALHNLSDAAAIFIALVARKIGNKPANNSYHFGYIPKPPQDGLGINAQKY